MSPRRRIRGVHPSKNAPRQGRKMRGTGRNHMPKMFQIHEDDLAALEREVPAVFDALMQHLDSRLRVKARTVQGILSRVRWNYGPPSEVLIVPVDDQAP